MNTSMPYLCSRCLRASRQHVTRTDALLKRTYRVPAIASWTQNRTTSLSSRTQQTAIPISRYISTTPPLRKPSLETQPTSGGPPHPSQVLQAEQAKQKTTTTTLLNPRTDEETGEAMSIGITPRATKRLKHIMTKDANPNLCLRVTVESGGCHGFQYLMSLVDISTVDEAEDSLFVGGEVDASGGAEWRSKVEGKPKVVIDEASLELLKGSNVDYTMELIGSQFKIDNPRASSSCGCGTSFDVKI